MTSFALIPLEKNTPKEAYHRYAKENNRASLTINYVLKNYLLLLSSIKASMGPAGKRFKRVNHIKETFALGYFEDIYSHKIYYLEGIKGSKFMTMTELEKDDKRYNLSDIVVNKDNALVVEAHRFFSWLKEVSNRLAQDISIDTDPGFSYKDL